MEQVMQYLVEFSPAITAIVSVLVTIIVGIKKIKGHNDKAIKELRDAEQRIVVINEQRNEDLEQLRRENAELKADIRKLMAKLEHVHFMDKK